MSRKIIRIKLLLLGKKINTETTHEFFKKPPTIFHIFQFHIRRTQQKSPSFSKFTVAALPRVNHIRRYEKNITWTTHYPRNPYPHTTKTTCDHEDDGIMETI